MTTPPRVPRPGDPISAGWGGKLAHYARMTTPKAGPGLRARVTGGGTVLSIAAAHKRNPLPAPYPFKAVWIDDSGGELCFCLPSGSLWVDGEAVDPAANATQSTVQMTSGTWYCFPSITLASSGDMRIYCEIKESSGSSGSSGAYCAELVAQVSPDALYSFAVCDISITAATSAAPAQYLVRQLAIGTQHVSLASGGSGGGSTPCDCPRKWYNRIAINAAGTQATISNPRVLHGVQDVEQKSGTSLTVTIGTSGNTWIYYEITHGTGTGGTWQYELKASGTEPSQFSGETYQVPLYVVDSNGKIWDASIPMAVKRI